ncbi:MAG: S8 family serine peptidase [Jatrophihabitans sp.]
MKRARSVRIAVVTATVATTVAGALTAAQGSAAAPTGSADKHESVIVVLKDQLAGTPATTSHVDARRTAARSAQSSILHRLLGATPTHLVNYTVGNAFSATITTAQAAQLATDPAVASVVPNRTVQVNPTAAHSPATPAAPRTIKPAAVGAPATVNPAACSTNPAKPLLEPEALQTINARSSDPAAKTAAQLGIDGSGVKVAYIADGINPNNAGFLRANKKSSVVDYKDFYGDGPNAPTSGAEAFGDASAISAQGNVVYDVKDYANPNAVTFPGGHCYIKIVGVSPGADVVALKAGSELLPNSAILQSIDYAVSVAKVNVINESFGANIYPDSSSRSTVQLFNDNAVKAGVTVVESSGDAGITSTIGSSATDPNVISTGASTDSRIYEQTDYALATAFGNGKWLDSNISALSSAGVTQEGRTIDVSAPGEADWAVCDDSGNFSGCTSFGNPDHKYAKIQAFGGTSQSSPMTAGVAALVIQAYKKTHGGTAPTPTVIKRIIASTSRDLGLPGDEQGSGLVDARAATEAALTWPGAKSAAPAGTRSNIALSSDQLTLTGQPGSTKAGTVTVTNVGNKTQSVVASARRYAQLSQATQNATLDTTSSQTTPYPTNGAPWVYKKVPFTVPSGADELASTIRWNSGATYSGPGPVVRLSLFTPDGTYAGNSRPQGGPAPSNYGLVTIKHPAAGTWTAVLYTPASGGYTGNVALDTQTYRAIPVGRVSPSTATLAPGASTTVRANLPVPSVGGDTVDTMSIGSSDGHQTAVPVVVRALVPTGRTPGTFAGQITGGNARSYAPAQTFSYAFDVPAGKRDVEVGVTLADDPKDLLEGVLIDPNGEVQSVNSNRTSSQGLSMQNTVAKPITGRWRYVVVVQSPVSGNELVENFTGTVAFDQIRTSGLTVPRKIKSGTSVQGTVTITNTGKAPMLVQADARRDGVQQVQLAPQFAGSTLQLPQSVDDLSQLPAYLVPPNTRQVSLTASTTSPAQVELSSPLGGIDLFGDLQSAQNGNTVSTASVSEARGSVGLGYWGTYVQQIGPFGDSGAPKATSVLAATALTKRFDDSVTTSTGDPFLAAVDPTTDSGTPIVIEPGATKTITVQIAPTARKGTTVTGVLNLVTPPAGVANVFNTTGEVLAALPYSYTVS